MISGPIGGRSENFTCGDAFPVAGDVVEPAPPAAPQPWYPPVEPPAPRRPGLSANAFVPLIGVFLGVLIFTGMVSFHAVFLIPIPTSFPPSTDPAIIDYRNTVRTLGWVSIVAMDLAVALSVMIAWIMGSVKGDLSEATRRGMFVFATSFLIVWLIFSFFAYTIFRSLIPFI